MFKRKEGRGEVALAFGGVEKMSLKVNVVKEYWDLFSEVKYAGTGALMHPNIIIRWPNTREAFRGMEKFISVNEQYPGKWIITIEKLFFVGETVISVVRVESIEQNQSVYATSFFTFEDDLIKEIVEYWSDNGEPPAWRIESGLSERY